MPVVGWHLGARRTLSLHPKAAGVLRLAQGRAWVTMGARQGLAGQPDSGDVVLHAGEELAVPAGAHLVMECWPVQPGDAVRFDWLPTGAVMQRDLEPRIQFGVARHAPSAKQVSHAQQTPGAAMGRAAWALTRLLRVA